MNKIDGLSYFFAALALSCSSVTFAASHEDVLKNLYYNATVPATPGDFSQVDLFTGATLQSRNMNCVIVLNDDSWDNFTIERVLRVIPPAGPLLPGRTEEKLYFQTSNSSLHFFDSLSLAKVKGADLVVTNSVYAQQTNPQSGLTTDVPASIFIRKAKNSIPFKLVVDPASVAVPSMEYYGYCYPHHSALF